jgi:putative glutamine amidotransferase
MVSLLSHPRPVIGISGSNADSASVRAMMTQVASSGAIPLFLSNHGARNAKRDIDKIDALIVMGNNADIDPARYGETPHSKTRSETQTPDGRARANYEYELMQIALGQKIPMLGVCGGMQRLAVMCGGKLHQHVPDLTGNDDHAQQEHNIAPFVPVQAVHIDENSTLGNIGNSLLASIGHKILSIFTPTHKDYSYQENSMHHQAVSDPGKGLRAVAFADDRLPDGSRLIEAIEADPNGAFKDQFLVGVQWHPEFSASELGAKIARRLTEEAQHYAHKHNRTHPNAEAQDETMLSSLDMLKKPAEGIRMKESGAVAYIMKRREELFSGQSRA